MQEQTRLPVTPPLSVVIATTQPWPELAMVLGSLWVQARAAGAELVVADGSPRGDGLPAQHGYGGIVWLRRPGASVFELRELGLARAHGEVIAITEDHCRVASDWCRQLIAVHAAHPDLLLIGGAVANGAKDVVDWASFFVANVASLPPERGPWRAGLTGQANVSYKRRLIADYGATVLASARLRAALERQGLARNDARLKVEHVQALGLVQSCLIHFHDGRCLAASRRRELDGMRLALELMKDLSLGVRVPIATARSLARTAWRHPELWRELALGAPLLTVMIGLHCVGELVGLTLGAGSSPTRMR